MTEEVLVYNLEEYSDFLLEEELYPKYKRFLSLLNKVDNTQIFLTGSIVDEAAYKETIPTAYYLPSLSEEDRLLKSNQN